MTGRPIIDLTGKRFGKLVVLHQSEFQAKGKPQRWVCQCDCGNIIEVGSANLRRGATTSCGCTKHDVAIKKLDKYRDRVYVDGTKLDQLQGSTIRKDNRSGVKGVWYDPKRKKYEVNISFKKKRYHLGRFDSLEEATEARRKAEEEIWEELRSEND